MPARLAVKKKSLERKRAFRGGAAAPSEAGRESVLPVYFRLRVGFLLKKVENPFDFSPTTCKLCFGIAFLSNGNPVSCSFHRLFQQKCEKTRQVKIVSFATKNEIPARTIVSFYLAGRLSVVLVAGSWRDLLAHVRGSVRLFCVCITGLPLRDYLLFSQQ